VYSVISRPSFESISDYHDSIIRDLDTLDGQVPIILVANKTDRADDRQVSQLEGKGLAKKLGCRFVEASAKEGKNVDTIFHYIAGALHKRGPPRPKAQQNLPLQSSTLSTMKKVVEKPNFLTWWRSREKRLRNNKDNFSPSEKPMMEEEEEEEENAPTDESGSNSDGLKQHGQHVGTGRSITSAFVGKSGQVTSDWASSGDALGGPEVDTKREELTIAFEVFLREHPYMGTSHDLQSMDIFNIRGTESRLQATYNFVLDWLQPSPAPGMVRVSWTCVSTWLENTKSRSRQRSDILQRCGKRVSLQVDKGRKVAAVDFAMAAAGPPNSSSISVTSSDSVNSSTGSVVTQETSYTSQDTDGTSDNDTSMEASIDHHGDPNPFIPAGVKMFMLLCVNSPMGLIKLENVDVTDVEKDDELFSRLRSEYRRCRGSRNWSPFMKPKTMHYIKVCECWDCPPKVTTDK
jgi:hypothetical protein